MLTIPQAIKIIKPLGDTLDALKKAYRLCAKQYHPDVNPQGDELMKIVNNAYDLLKNSIGRWSVNYQQQDTEDAQDIPAELQKIFNKINFLEGLFFEVCGNWLWVTGDTYPHRKELKSAGLRFSKKKSAWYWRPAGYKKRGKKQFSLDEIRQMHGSQGLTGNSRQQIHA